MPTSASPVAASTIELWQRAQTVLARALELPASQRHSLVDRECGSQDALAQYVRMMLDKNADPVDWLEEGVPHDDVSCSLLADGDVLGGRFEVVGMLGSGGMSEVYRVRDPWTARELALKLLIPELTDSEDTILRIQHEFHLAQRVSHPNVCQLSDISRHEDASRHPRVLHFITMELLEGSTLSTYLREHGPLPPVQALRFLEPIVAGLTAAHKAGVIHRDLKPGNLMVVPGNGGDLRIVITDFGMAVPLSESTPRRLARGRLIGGTPTYMAPEQYTTDDATPATDVFALGVILHEMLTGSTPFHASHLTALIESSMQPPNQPVAVSSAIPPRWAKTIIRCLEPAPDKRFQSAEEVLAAVRPRSRAPLYRRAAIGVLAGGIGAWWYAVAGGNGDAAPGSANEAARAAFARASMQGKRLTTDELLKSIANYEEALRLDPKYAEAWAGLAECYGRMQDYGGVPYREAAAKAQAAAAKAIELKPKLAQAHAALGLSLSLDVDRWKLAEKCFRRAISLRPGYASAHHGLGIHLARTGDMNEGVIQLREAVRLEPDSLTALNAYGWLLYFSGRSQEAIRTALSAIDLDPNWFYSHLLLARSYAALGDYPKALEVCAVATRLSTRGALGKALPVPPVVLSAEATIYVASGQSGEARKRLAELQERAKSEFIPVYYVASVQCVLGDKEGALDVLEHAYKQRDPGVLFVRLYPQFRALAAEPRYQRLLAQLGFDLNPAVKAAAARR